MALSQLDKMNILNMIKSHSITDIYYNDFFPPKEKIKYTEDEVIEFLINQLLKRLTSPTKFSKSMITKQIGVLCLIINICCDDYKNLDETNLVKLRTISSDYDTYITTFDLEPDSDLVHNFNELERITNECYPATSSQIEEVENIETAENWEEIKKLEEELSLSLTKIKEYQNTLEELNNMINTLEKNNHKKDTTINTLRQSKTHLEEIILELKEKIKINSSIISEIKGKLRIQTEQNANLKIQNDQLFENNQDLTKKLETLQLQLQQKESRLNEYQEEQSRIDIQKKLQQEQKQKDKKIEKIIITALYQTECSINQLIRILALNNIFLTQEEVHNHLSKIKQRINIKKTNFVNFVNFAPTYEIDKTPQVKESTFNIQPLAGQQCYDILISSDYHIKIINDQLLKQIDQLYEYATKNSIPLIINLGDTFDSIKIIESGLIFENLIKAEQLLEESIHKLPSSPNIYQAYLGGNHDKKLLRFGLDPIQILTESRSDFISLGYSHSKLTFGSAKNSNNNIYLHHPNVKFEELIPNNKVSLPRKIEEYLSNYYQANRMSREESYIDILGHTHKSTLDIMNSYCTAPSYTSDRQSNGVWHLKVYFNSKQEIDYIIFLPLISIENNLTAISQIPYQKIKVKK